MGLLRILFILGTISLVESANLVSNPGFESLELDGWQISDEGIHVCQVGRGGCINRTGSFSYILMGQDMDQTGSCYLSQDIEIPSNGNITISGLIGRFPDNTSDEFMLTMDFANIHETLLTQDNITNLTHFQIYGGEVSRGVITLKFSLSYSSNLETHIFMDNIKVEYEKEYDWMIGIMTTSIFAIFGILICVMVHIEKIRNHYKNTNKKEDSREDSSREDSSGVDSSREDSSGVDSSRVDSSRVDSSC